MPGRGATVYPQPSSVPAARDSKPTCDNPMNLFYSCDSAHAIPKRFAPALGVVISVGWSS